jgi:hypothetical protein
MVRTAPTPAEVLPILLGFLGDATLVGHNIEDFDYPILRRTARQAGLPVPRHELIDTFKMARRLLPEASSHRLEGLAGQLEPGIVQQHRALPDARLTARVFFHLLDVLRREQELDALSEALPLVALSIDAAGVPIRDENATLVLAGARAVALGQGEDLRLRWQAESDPATFQRGEAWLSQYEWRVPSDDADWELMEERWREAVAVYCRTASDCRLPAFLHYAALAQAIDYVPTVAPQPDATLDRPARFDPRRIPLIGRVAMMTVHAAKGMEWPLVFLLGAEDDQFPLWLADDEEEERRVLYVSMTRARRRLCILWAARAQGRSRELSPFLRDLPAEVIDRRP